VESFVTPREARAATIDADQLVAVRDLARLCLEDGQGGREAAHARARDLTTAIGEPRMWQAIQRHRLVELVDQGGILPPESELTLALHADAIRRRAIVGTQAEATIEVLALLRSRQVDVLVVKGLPLAVQSTGDPFSRASTDIDLWVDPGSLAIAIRALLAAGWAYRPAGCYPEPDAGRAWDWAQLTQREVQLRRDDVSVDVHWHLAAATGHVPDFEAAWRARRDVDTPWGPMPTLRPDHALAHSCLHAATDDWRSLRSLVDVRRLTERIDPGRVAALADRLRTVRRTLLVTGHSVGLGTVSPPAPHWVDRHLGTTADRSQCGRGRIHRPATAQDRLSVAWRQAQLGSTATDYLRWGARIGLRRQLNARRSAT
jgi:hypothetical protein